MSSAGWERAVTWSIFILTDADRLMWAAFDTRRAAERHCGAELTGGSGVKMDVILEVPMGERPYGHEGAVR